MVTFESPKKRHFLLHKKLLHKKLLHKLEWVGGSGSTKILIFQKVKKNS